MCQYINHALPWLWAALIAVRVESLLIGLNPSGLHKPLLSTSVPMGQPNTLQLSLSQPWAWPSFSSGDGPRAGMFPAWATMLQRWHREGFSCRRGSLTGYGYSGISFSCSQGELSYCFGFIPITGGPWSRPSAVCQHSRSLASVHCASHWAPAEWRAAEEEEEVAPCPFPKGPGGGSGWVSSPAFAYST